MLKRPMCDSTTFGEAVAWIALVGFGVCLIIGASWILTFLLEQIDD